jgi:hypothetical protein
MPLGRMIASELGTVKVSSWKTGVRPTLTHRRLTSKASDKPAPHRAWGTTRRPSVIRSLGFRTTTSPSLNPRTISVSNVPR